MKTCKDFNIKPLDYCLHCYNSANIIKDCSIVEWYNYFLTIKDEGIIKYYNNYQKLNAPIYLETAIHYYFPHLTDTINKIKLLK